MYDSTYTGGAERSQYGIDRKWDGSRQSLGRRTKKSCLVGVMFQLCNRTRAQERGNGDVCDHNTTDLYTDKGLRK